MTLVEVDSPRYRLGGGASKPIGLAAAIGVIGLAAAIVVALLMGEGGIARLSKSYLLAFLFINTIALGGLFFTFIHHATHAGWSTSLRRISEIFSANLIWAWLAFLPILILVIAGEGKLLYSWMDPAKLAKDVLYQHKEPYLNVPFWLGRAVAYFAVWAFFAWMFLKQSTAQDEDGDPKRTLFMQKLAPACALLFALTLTYSAVDWIMALEAHWFSTIFGVYLFAASCCGYFSAQIITVYLLQRAGKLQNEITLEHYQDMGKLLFAFGVVFWAYIGFSQFMLLWYANLPETTTWYIARTIGPWLPVSWLLLIGHFVLPFLILVTKHTKRVPGFLALIAGGMLVMHLIDLYWLVMPEIPSAAEFESVGQSMPLLRERVESGEIGVGWDPSLLDLACVVGLAGLAVAAVIGRMRRVRLLAVRDPRLGEAIAFENM